MPPPDRGHDTFKRCPRCCHLQLRPEPHGARNATRCGLDEPAHGERGEHDRQVCVDGLAFAVVNLTQRTCPSLPVKLRVAEPCPFRMDKIPPRLSPVGAPRARDPRDVADPALRTFLST